MSTLQASAQNQLRQFVEQIERLEEEKKNIANDIRDKYAEAKAMGFDVKALRELIKLRKKSKSEREEAETVLDVYKHALGMADDEPAPNMTSRLAMEAATPSAFGCTHCGALEGHRHREDCAALCPMEPADA